MSKSLLEQAKEILEHLKKNEGSTNELTAPQKDILTQAKELLELAKKEKGVHQRASGGDKYKGQSPSGKHIRGNEDNKAAAQQDVKYLHQKVLAEQQSMPKPNLPKAELEKAKVDEGKTSREKMHAREARAKTASLPVKQDISQPIKASLALRQAGKSTHSGYQKEPHAPYGALNQAADLANKEARRRQHLNIDKQAKIKPNLPKAEMTAKDDMPHQANSPEDKAHDIKEEGQSINEAMQPLSIQEARRALRHLRSLKDDSQLRSPENQAVGKAELEKAKVDEGKRAGAKMLAREARAKVAPKPVQSHRPDTEEMMRHKASAKIAPNLSVSSSGPEKRTSIKDIYNWNANAARERAVNTAKERAAASRQIKPNLPKAEPKESKHDRCVEQVKEQSPKVSNPHAVCVASGVKPDKWKK